MDPFGDTLWQLLRAAWLLPLVSFTVIVFGGKRLGKGGVLAGYLATAAIVGAFLLSITAFGLWLNQYGVPEEKHHGAEHHAAASATGATTTLVKLQDSNVEDLEHAEAKVEKPKFHAGEWYRLAEFGSLRLAIGYHIDALTICMFAMITLIASCIHFYAMGYMHDELHEIVDHEVHVHGHHLHRPGRYYRFFQYLSLFCFSMLGLVIAGNVMMVFVFWELVGVCSYFLIGFYIERKSASNAANKAFIVNRVGDFGMLIGLMALWASLGTFTFAGVDENGDGTLAQNEKGIFDLLREPEHGYLLSPSDGMVADAAAADPSVAALPTPENIQAWRAQGYGYWLLVIAGIGIFCGCVGKSAQFPLHVWLPDAMEGPTPVSALVHSATMVAAGVYLVGRFYPAFPPETLLVIAYAGAITLFLAATIAITATDIKRVLAYSTVSQLGYMMFSLGIGGWIGGLFHLFTHAFFKSLLFMCSGSVIHATHTNEMPKMGGLRKKMPWTAYTMLIGCLAIAGAGLPFTVFGRAIGFSGFYSKDAIIMHSLWFGEVSPKHGWLGYLPVISAAITAFYMFRMWFMTFAGKPRDHHIYDHAHESPPIMYVPLVILSVFAVAVAWRVPISGLNLEGLLDSARWPATDPAAMLGFVPSSVADPHEFHTMASLVAFSMAGAGVLIAAVFYGWGYLNPDEVSRQFAPIYRLLINKWYFDEIYNVIFIRPTHFIAARIANFDKKWIDGFIDLLARWTLALAKIDDLIDRYFVDGLVNAVARWTFSTGVALRGVQTGRLRQYVMFIVVGTVALFVMISFYATRA
jgi:NADH-quinone oxidoreductase subunit L